MYQKPSKTVIFSRSKPLMLEHKSIFSEACMAPAPGRDVCDRQDLLDDNSQMLKPHTLITRNLYFALDKIHLVMDGPLLY